MEQSSPLWSYLVVSGSPPHTSWTSLSCPSNGTKQLTLISFCFFRFRTFPPHVGPDIYLSPWLTGLLKIKNINLSICLYQHTHYPDQPKLFHCSWCDFFCPTTSTGFNHIDLVHLCFGYTNQHTHTMKSKLTDRRPKLFHCTQSQCDNLSKRRQSG